MPIVSFKASPEQLRELRRLARAGNISVSEYVRRSALPSEQAAPAVKMKKHPVSGAYYNAAPGQRSPTQAEIDAALADFP